MSKETTMMQSVEDLKNEIPPELVIGLVGAVGTELDVAITILTERLGCAGYEVEVIKISQHVIPDLISVDIDAVSKYERINRLMTAGNQACSRAGTAAILAYGAVRRIYQSRTIAGENREPFKKKAFIINSLKRPKEVSELRHIYANGFFLIGVHSDLNRRKNHMKYNLQMTDDQIEALIERDSDEQRNSFGQKLNKTFHLADFFVRISGNRDTLRHDIQRMVELWFGNPRITPTFEEFAMYMAFASALRSADLSRQVGAVVARKNQILATGANDCPCPGGGLYWPEREPLSGRIVDKEKGRDYMLKEDSNRKQQLEIIESIIADCGKNDIDESKMREILGSSKISDLTEYGRVVHAEMEALLACGRIGVSTLEATLYSTTFPCHNCAKHIIAAGISRVVYVEPYPKSKASEFHLDAINFDPDIKSDPRVQFAPFVGIGPRRFFDLYSMNLGMGYPLKRKDDDTGMASDWRIETSKLRIKMFAGTYIDLEAYAVRNFLSETEAVKSTPTPASTVEGLK